MPRDEGYPDQGGPGARTSGPPPAQYFQPPSDPYKYRFLDAGTVEFLNPKTGRVGTMSVEHIASKNPKWLSQAVVKKAGAAAGFAGPPPKKGPAGLPPETELTAGPPSVPSTGSKEQTVLGGPTFRDAWAFLRPQDREGGSSLLGGPTWEQAREFASQYPGMRNLFGTPANDVERVVQANQGQLPMESPPPPVDGPVADQTTNFADRLAGRLGGLVAGGVDPMQRAGQAIVAPIMRAVAGRPEPTPSAAPSRAAQFPGQVLAPVMETVRSVGDAVSRIPENNPEGGPIGRYMDRSGEAFGSALRGAAGAATGLAGTFAAPAADLFRAINATVGAGAGAVRSGAQRAADALGLGPETPIVPESEMGDYRVPDLPDQFETLPASQVDNMALRLLPSLSQGSSVPPNLRTYIVRNWQRFDPVMQQALRPLLIPSH